MKVKYVYAKKYVDVKPVLEKALPLLKGKVGIVATIQFLHLTKNIKEFLDKKQIKNEIIGQVLGCNVYATQRSDADTILYFGDGVFHPLGISLKNKTPIIIADPISMNVKKLSDDEIKKFDNVKRKGLTKFYSSTNVGVLVSLKPGQEQMKAALGLKNKYKDKNFYILVFNDLDYNQLENFPFIECYVNTMCPRIAYDDAYKIPKPVVDYLDLK